MPSKAPLFLSLLAAFGFLPCVALAEPAVAPFYQAVMKMKPEGRLGQVIKKEKIETPIEGAQAWRIAYISSDLNDKRTISTGQKATPRQAIVQLFLGHMERPGMLRAAAHRRLKTRRGRLTSTSW